MLTAYVALAPEYPGFDMSLLMRVAAALQKQIVRDVAPNLVSIQSARSRLSGFSWRPGLIVAAENALPDDDEHSVVAHDGASTPARVMGRDPSTDVALLRLERNDLPRAPSAAGVPAVGALAVVAGAREGAAAAALGIVSFVGPQWRSLRGGRQGERRQACGQAG